MLTVEEKARYDDLTTDLFTNKPKYFVIMKGMRIDDKLDFALDTGSGERVANARLDIVGDASAAFVDQGDGAFRRDPL